MAPAPRTVPAAHVSRHPVLREPSVTRTRTTSRAAQSTRSVVQLPLRSALPKVLAVTEWEPSAAMGIRYLPEAAALQAPRYAAATTAMLMTLASMANAVLLNSSVRGNVALLGKFAKISSV